MKTSTIVMMSSFIFFTSCGETMRINRNLDGLESLEKNLDSSFEVSMVPVNDSMIRGQGSLNLSETTDMFEVNIEVENGEVNTQYEVAIMDGSSCSDMLDKVLIPLDDDLETNDGDRQPQETDEAGTISVQGSGALSGMLANLKEEDQDTTDDVVKLEANEELNLNQRVVAVRSVTGEERAIVACGEILMGEDGGTTNGGTTTGGETSGGTSTGGKGGGSSSDTSSSTTGGTTDGDLEIPLPY